MNRSDTLTRYITRISQDLGWIVHTLSTVQQGVAPTPDQAYLLQQLRKYLKPINFAQPGTLPNTQQDMGRLHDFFTVGTMAARLANWYDGTGNEPALAGDWQHRLKLWLAFGYSPRNGVPGQLIVMQKKAWLLTENVFAGVMVHESTHFVLGTQDHAYDANYRPGHAKLQELNAQTRYDNADNWRIFYQKMSVYFRREYDGAAVPAPAPAPAVGAAAPAAP